MPTKTGMGGHAPEAYDPSTGKFIEDGSPNVRHDNPTEANKIKNHISPEKIQEQSAAKQTAPTPNLGKYAKVKTLRDDYGLDVSKYENEPIDMDESYLTADEGSLLDEFYGGLSGDRDVDNERMEVVHNFAYNPYKYLSMYMSDYSPNKLSDEELNSIKESGKISNKTFRKSGFKDEKELEEGFKNFLKEEIFVK